MRSGGDTSDPDAETHRHGRLIFPAGGRRTHDSAAASSALHAGRPPLPRALGPYDLAQSGPTR